MRSDGMKLRMNFKSIRFRSDFSNVVVEITFGTF